MATQKMLEGYEQKLQELEKNILLGRGDIINLEVQLAECHSKISCLRQALQKQTVVLGVNEHADLIKLCSSAYLQVSDNSYILTSLH